MCGCRYLSTKQDVYSRIYSVLAMWYGCDYRHYTEYRRPLLDVCVRACVRVMCMDPVLHHKHDKSTRTRSPLLTQSSRLGCRISYMCIPYTSMVCAPIYRHWSLRITCMRLSWLMLMLMLLLLLTVCCISLHDSTCNTCNLIRFTRMPTSRWRVSAIICRDWQHRRVPLHMPHSVACCRSI